jgi:mRNA-degrading endonuclease HigB of HigAB toxin-antitoxin module
LRLVNKFILQKLRNKNLGNIKLVKAIDKLVFDIENTNFNTPQELIDIRPDADCVYGGEFYFFNINVHRTMILIEFEDDGEVTIVWAGNHDDYEKIFKNNRNVIKKWLKDNSWI